MCDCKPLKYKVLSELIDTPTTFDSTGCNAVIFVNRGEALAIVNGEEIQTNQQISNSGLKGEIDTTQYKISFVNTGVQTQKVFVRQKKYDGQ